MQKTLRQILNEQEKITDGISPSQFIKDQKSNKRVDYDWIHEHAQNHLTGDISHIDEKDKASIGRYTQNSSPGYKEINGYMRDHNAHAVGKPHALRIAHAIEGHKLPNAVWGYRGIHSIHSENLNKLKPGDVFHNKGFASTTLDPNRATHFARGEDVMAIHMPKGQSALYMSHPKLNSWTSEREMVLPHNTHFKYNGHEMITAHEHDYSGRPTGNTRQLKMHHVEIVPHSTNSIQIDR